MVNLTENVIAELSRERNDEEDVEINSFLFHSKYLKLFIVNIEHCCFGW